MKTKILFVVFMVLCATVVIAQNNVGIGTVTPAAKLDVQGNGINYDVFNAANDLIPPFDSNMTFTKQGYLGIGTTLIGNYQLLSMGKPSAFSPQIEVWKGNPNIPGSRMLGDINDMGIPLFNGVLHLYINNTKTIELVAAGNSYLNGGNIGIGTMVPSALLDVRGNGLGYDLLNVSNDKAIPLDSILAVDLMGHVGIGTNFPGPYALKVLGANSAFQYQVEVWDNDPAIPASRMLGDISDAGGQNGMLSLYLNGNKRVLLRANGTSYLANSFLGIGLTVPKERLHLNGALIVNSHFQAAGAEVAGTIEWDGANFRGFDGTNWINLDVQNQPDIDWQIIPSGWPPALGNPELVPMMPPASISMSFPGDPNQGGLVWIPDRTLPGIYPHQLMLESTTNALLSDASMLFRMSDWSLYPNSPPYLVDDYSMGIYRGDMSFKIYRGSVLAPTIQGDNFSMFRANPSGIIDLPNQSRVRAYQTDPEGLGQLIQPNVWTPVNFNNDSPLASGYDEQNEFTTSTSAHVLPAPPPNAYFTAMKDGYYQVNARCEFDVTSYTDPQGGGGNVIVANGDWISIAIYVGMQGMYNPYAWGNKLQIGNNAIPPENKLWNNNAPNVSDVIYLQTGQTISIWVYQTANTPMNLVPGPAKLYVSIHKVS